MEAKAQIQTKIQKAGNTHELMSRRESRYALSIGARAPSEVPLETLLYTITFTTAQNSHSLYTYSTSGGIVFLSNPGIPYSEKNGSLGSRIQDPASFRAKLGKIL